ncbi:MAG: hypothetical protein OEZ22_14870 [Spirochaetia bacterium]|nr:hypothetical protein [Spirochaetia bacterium]
MNKQIKIAISKPILPVIIFSENKLYSADKYVDLENILIKIIKDIKINDIKIIDSTGGEYFFMEKIFSIMPDFFGHRFSKKQIIDLFNNNCKNKENRYEIKSLSNKKIAEIVKHIAELIRIDNKK